MTRRAFRHRSFSKQTTPYQSMNQSEISSATDSAEFEEAPVLKRRRVRDDGEMDITPMIDITFLLLIFFLVASKMEADSEVTLPKARNGTAVTVKSSAVLTITPGTGDAVNVYTGNGAVEENRITSIDLAEQEAVIADYVERMMRDENKQQIIIKAEKSVKHREVSRVMQACGFVDDAKVFVAVLEES